MRSLVFAILGFTVACGDNIRPGLSIETHVASHALVAGDPVGARCSIVDEHGDPALDKDGNPLSAETDFVISYEAPEHFADAGGVTVAAKVGSATVRCAAPSLAIVDATPEDVTIAAGPPVRVITQLASPTTIAGQPDGVTCLAFDAYDNPVANVTQALSLSPTGAGTTTTATEVTATLIGEYTVTCVVSGAADVQPATLVVLPALPASIAGVLDPARTIYAILDQVTLIAAVFDKFGNRVDDVTYAYSATPTVQAPGPARFLFSQDGTYGLTARVTSTTDNNVPLSVTLPAFVDSNGPIIDCMRLDATSVASDAYMVQQAPATVLFPVRLGGAFTPATVTIGGAPASIDSSTGNWTASVPLNFGMNFIDVVATDNNGVQNSKTCFVLAGTFFSPEANPMAGSLALRLDQYAIGDPDPTGIDSLNDLFYTVLKSDALRQLVDQALSNANPINNGGCGVFACNPDVNYNAGSLGWDTPTTTMTLINGGFRAYVHLPNVHLTVRACGTTCCIGGSTIQVTASYIDATVDFGLTLQGGVVRTAVLGTPNVTVGSVNLNGSGFCGFIINLVQSFFTGTVKNAVQNALASFINNKVGPMLDSITSSLDISTLAQQFNVPRLDNTGTVSLGFGLQFSSLDINTTRALIGIGTRFTPGATAVNRPSLGIARRTSDPLVDPPGTSDARPVAVSAYEGVLNQVLHALWRAGYFQANLSIGGGTATIDSWLPPVAVVGNNNTAELMLGGVYATLTIPGLIDQPITVMFGGHANATVSMNGNALTFGNLNLDKLYVSFAVTLSQQQRDAMEQFLKSALADVLANALNNGLPAFPIPSFTLPASVATYGLPAGAQLGIVNPVLTTGNAHCVLDGQFGEQ